MFLNRCVVLQPFAFQYCNRSRSSIATLRSSIATLPLCVPVLQPKKVGFRVIVALLRSSIATNIYNIYKEIYKDEKNKKQQKEKDHVFVKLVKITWFRFFQP